MPGENLAARVMRAVVRVAARPCPLATKALDQGLVTRRRALQVPFTRERKDAIIRNHEFQLGRLGLRDQAAAATSGLLAQWTKSSSRNVARWKGLQD